MASICAKESAIPFCTLFYLRFGNLTKGYFQTKHDKLCAIGGIGRRTRFRFWRDEYITVEQIEGRVKEFLKIYPWTQYYDLKDRKDQPLSYAEHITMKDCDCICDTFFDVMPDESQYLLSDFTLQDLRIRARVDNFSEDKLRSVVYENVQVEESTEPAESWHEVKGFQ